jgi:hypothetical protein
MRFKMHMEILPCLTDDLSVYVFFEIASQKISHLTKYYIRHNIDFSAMFVRRAVYLSFETNDSVDRCLFGNHLKQLIYLAWLNMVFLSVGEM